VFFHTFSVCLQISGTLSEQLKAHQSRLADKMNIEMKSVVEKA